MHFIALAYGFYADTSFQAATIHYSVCRDTLHLCLVGQVQCLLTRTMLSIPCVISAVQQTASWTGSLSDTSCAFASEPHLGYISTKKLPTKTCLIVTECTYICPVYGSYSATLSRCKQMWLHPKRCPPIASVHVQHTLQSTKLCISNYELVKHLPCFCKHTTLGIHISQAAANKTSQQVLSGNLSMYNLALFQHQHFNKRTLPMIHTNTLSILESMKA